MDGEELRFYKFLEYYKLEQYHEEFVKMGVKQIAHLRDVNDGDLTDIGMSGPEKVRLSRKMNENFSMMGRLVKRLKRKDGRFNTQESTRRRHGALKMQQSAVKESKTPIIFAIENVNLGKKLGDGANGEVHEAQLLVPQHEAVIVAAKTIYRKDKGPSIEEMFLKEVQSMFELNHDHIIKLYGMVLGNPLILVEELAPLGNLLSYIKNNPVHLGLIHTYAVQLADAMEYLEFNKIIHRDLAARNVLLINEQHVKLSDFGLARKLQEDDEIYQHSNYDVPLPTAWLAPEALKKGEFSSASDVWSYGVLLWELTSLGGRPWEGLTPVEIFQKLNFGDRLPRPQYCYVKLYKLMKMCWDVTPNDRPSFKQIHSMLLMDEYSPVVVILTDNVTSHENIKLTRHERVYVIERLGDRYVTMTTNGKRATLPDTHTSPAATDNIYTAAATMQPPLEQQEQYHSIADHAIIGRRSTDEEDYITMRSNPIRPSSATSPDQQDLPPPIFNNRQSLQNALNKSSSSSIQAAVHPAVQPVVQPVVHPVVQPVVQPVVKPVVKPVVVPTGIQLTPIPTQQYGYSSLQEHRKVPPASAATSNKAATLGPANKQTPPPLPPRKQISHDITSSESEIMKKLKDMFPDVNHITLYNSLMKNNGNIDMAIDDVKVEQLMGFGLEYITREDCHRALRHCGGKVDRAGTWLLEQNDAISSRRKHTTTNI
jgi:activated CDC42 kinase 1